MSCNNMKNIIFVINTRKHQYCISEAPCYIFIFYYVFSFVIL